MGTEGLKGFCRGTSIPKHDSDPELAGGRGSIDEAGGGVGGGKGGGEVVAAGKGWGWGYGGLARLLKRWDGARERGGSMR